MILLSAAALAASCWAAPPAAVSGKVSAQPRAQARSVGPYESRQLRYAKLFYQGKPEGVNFNEDALPDYADFLYLALTIGMTFQVSDTNLTTKAIRRTALRHAVLSYMYGALIIATTINLIAGLGK